MKDSKYIKLFGEDWEEFFRDFIESDDFKKIGKELKTIWDSGVIVYPSFSDVFRPFKECRLKDLKIVFLTMNPYCEGYGDGLAFSCANAPYYGDMPEVLKTVFHGVEDSFKELHLDVNADLTRWANQGVLLLNIDPTTLSGKWGKHIELWKPFISFLLEKLSNQQPAVYVLIGTQAQAYKSLINSKNNDIILIEHPMNAVREMRKWDCKNLFYRLNLICTMIFNKTIQWI